MPVPFRASTVELSIQLTPDIVWYNLHVLNESSNKFKYLLNCLSTMAIFGLGCVLVLQYKHGHRWLFNRGMHSTDRQLPPFRKSVVTTWPSPAKTGLCLFLKGKGFVYTWPQSQTLLPMQVEWIHHDQHGREHGTRRGMPPASLPGSLGMRLGHHRRKRF